MEQERTQNKRIASSSSRQETSHELLLHAACLVLRHHLPFPFPPWSCDLHAYDPISLVGDTHGETSSLSRYNLHLKHRRSFVHLRSTSHKQERVHIVNCIVSCEREIVVRAVLSTVICNKRSIGKRRERKRENGGCCFIITRSDVW